ncbi:MAG: beta-ketoacyl-ACP synthase II [Anaerolineae bacterium]|nr:beta-ketoacyl-ACP synthase II [Anaerolineae bacterium]NUQ03853.1 beta-ketoacyl-ACP synthase II [Anaerolineae bacterium]
MTRRVVVTGYGVISPLGQSAAQTWENLKAGVSGVSALTRFDSSTSQVKISAEVRDWDASKFMSPKDARRRDLNEQFGAAAAKMAVEHAGMVVDDTNRMRTGVIIGSAVGGIGSYWAEAKKVFETSDLRSVTPFGIPMLLVNGASDIVSIDLGAQGPSYTPISACATGADCIGHAYDLIRYGKIDQAVAGGCEAPIIPIGIAAFDRTGACSRMNDNPTGAVRPFSKDRAGLVFGEGAGVLVLEELEHAKARGATIHAELVGYGCTSDAFHITAPEPEGMGASNAIRQALDDAGMLPEQIHYINAHGTATSLNDVMETKAVKRIFGDHAYRIPISSTKSMTGHGMGATAGMEVIFSIMAMRDCIAPPTINLEEPDPECDLDYVPNQAREMQMDCVMSNSFGFGGHNVSLIIKRFNG